MINQHRTELDDAPIPEAVMDVTWAIQPAEPDVGVMRASVECYCEIVSWQIGALHLNRAQLCQAIGTAEVEAIEDREAAIVAERIEAGEYHDDRDCDLRREGV